jgi:hypothetical protein
MPYACEKNVDGIVQAAMLMFTVSNKHQQRRLSFALTVTPLAHCL